jgi:hypothetical protein
MKAALPSPSTVIGPRVTAFDTQSSSSSRESQTSGCSVTTRLGAAGPAIRPRTERLNASEGQLAMSWCAFADADVGLRVQDAASSTGSVAFKRTTHATADRRAPQNSRNPQSSVFCGLGVSALIVASACSVYARATSG